MGTAGLEQDAKTFTAQETRVKHKPFESSLNSSVLNHHGKTSCVFGPHYWQYQAADQESAV